MPLKKEIRERPNDWAMVKQILSDHGLDPNVIAEDGVDREGYFQFVLDGDGNRVIQPDHFYAIQDRHNWPEGFPVETFLTLYLGYPVYA